MTLAHELLEIATNYVEARQDPTDQDAAATRQGYAQQFEETLDLFLRERA